MMKNRRWIGILGLLALLAMSPVALGQSSDRVVKAKAYASTDGVRPGDKFTVAVELEIEKGYHINANKPSLDYLIATEVKFEPVAGLRFGEPKYPAPEYQSFEFAPDTKLAVHDDIVYITAEVEADASIKPGAATLPVLVTVQSCNDTQCLVPADLRVEVPIRFVAAGQPVAQANEDVFRKAAESLVARPSTQTELVQFEGGARQDEFSALLESRGMLGLLIGIFIAGLALNLTPCVYPIIPITIGFFLNQGQREGRGGVWRALPMALMYVVGMAITYSILGVIAAMTKGLFGAALQNPLVLIGLAALMVGLALSMFGVYEFKLPEALNRFATRSTQSTSGLLGALVMGLTMGIVAAPCIGPFVLGLLVHVGTVGDPLYGFFLFFVLALGLGFPYLILGTFSSAIKQLPRSGLWMVTVRKVFGLVLIGMALYFLMPLMGDWSKYVFIAFFAIAAAYLIFFEAGKAKPAGFGWVLRAIGVAAAGLAVYMAIPAKAGQPIEWQPYSEAAVAEAQRQGKGVLIDVYADWCIPCKELDQITFRDGDVFEEAQRFVALKLDLTTSDTETEKGRIAAAAKEKFDIRGVPTIIFLDPQGRERADLRLEGFEPPDRFLSRMKRLEFTPSAAPVLAANSSGNGNALPVADGAAPAGGSAYAPAPTVAMELLDGGTVSLEGLKGKVVLVDFWATWCVPCIGMIPTYNQLYKEYKDRGLEIIAVSLDEQGAEIVRPFLRQYPMDYTQVLGNASVASAFGVEESSLPVGIVVDKQGRVRSRHVGVVKKAQLQEEIEQLLNE